ncbi:hypothetical protein U1Q18_010435 [Sarracenia purpurea var. burkii]
MRPVKAVDPGLVYDASYTDYLLFLCTNGLSNLDPSFSCPKSPPSSNALNYPSLSISKLNGTVSVKRTVTNVGGWRSVYFSRVKPPPRFSVKVSPPLLFFHGAGLKRSFTFTVEAKREAEGGAAAVGGNEYAFGWYSWYLNRTQEPVLRVKHPATELGAGGVSLFAPRVVDLQDGRPVDLRFPTSPTFGTVIQPTFDPSASRPTIPCATEFRPHHHRDPRCRSPV